MRKVINTELLRLRSISGGFNSHNWRWKQTFLGMKLEDIPFDDDEFMWKYTNSELLELYTLITRQYFKQG